MKALLHNLSNSSSGAFDRLGNSSALHIAHGLCATPEEFSIRHKKMVGFMEASGSNYYSYCPNCYGPTNVPPQVAVDQPSHQFSRFSVDEFSNLIAKTGFPFFKTIGDCLLDERDIGLLVSAVQQEPCFFFLPSSSDPCSIVNYVSDLERSEQKTFELLMRENGLIYLRSHEQIFDLISILQHYQCRANPLIIDPALIERFVASEGRGNYCPPSESSQVAFLKPSEVSLTDFPFYRTVVDGHFLYANKQDVLTLLQGINRKANYFFFLQNLENTHIVCFIVQEAKITLYDHFQFFTFKNDVYLRPLKDPVCHPSDLLACYQKMGLEPLKLEEKDLQFHKELQLVKGNSIGDLLAYKAYDKPYETVPDDFYNLIADQFSFPSEHVLGFDDLMEWNRAYNLCLPLLDISSRAAEEIDKSWKGEYLYLRPNSESRRHIVLCYPQSDKECKWRIQIDSVKDGAIFIRFLDGQVEEGALYDLKALLNKYQSILHLIPFTQDVYFNAP